MIVTSPTDRWLRAALDDCRTALLVSSPYVGGYLREIVAQLERNISFTLLTRTLLADFATHASDLEAVRALAVRSGGVLSLSSLHAKVYVIDKRRALITSANATLSGMYRNRECGFEIKRRDDVQRLADLIDSGFQSRPKPEIWTADDLDELREPVESLRSALPRVTTIAQAAIEAPPRIQLRRRQFARLIESLSGWLQLTMEGISRIGSDVFSMNDVLTACAPLAAARYPDNRHVREKLRQQMQRLRDLGLVLFLGNGRYERLTRPE
jgi:Dam-replacing HTH domain/PLD-like domain